MTQLLCESCDVFVGFGAQGVVIEPADKSQEWKRDHCWFCHRSIDQVIEENNRRNGINPRGTIPMLEDETRAEPIREHRMQPEPPALDGREWVPGEHLKQAVKSEPTHDHNYLSAKPAGEPAESPVERMSGVYDNLTTDGPDVGAVRREWASADPGGIVIGRAMADKRKVLWDKGEDVRIDINKVPLPSAEEVASVALSTYVDKAMFDAEPIPEEGRDRPRVYLLSATPDPLGAVAAFSMMYEGRVIRDLAEITDDERRHYFDECFKTALQTPLEAIDLHFMIEGMTRATFDQMRTQRTAVFAGESLRFAVKEDLNDAVRPGPGVTGKALESWKVQMGYISDTYHYLIANGVPAEDARGILPMNVLTRAHWKTNLRNLQAEVGKRLCTQAQFEWRVLHADLRRAIREYMPTIRVNRGETVLRAPDWQWEYIASSPMFQPICFQKGACMFKASMDRGCTIRERVERGEFDKIQPEEWLTDPKAAWVE